MVPLVRFELNTLWLLRPFSLPIGIQGHIIKASGRLYIAAHGFLTTKPLLLLNGTGSECQSRTVTHTPKVCVLPLHHIRIVDKSLSTFYNLLYHKFNKKSRFWWVREVPTLRPRVLQTRAQTA